MEKEDSNSISISGYINFKNISNTRELILSAFNCEAPIILDVENIIEADVTLAQLIEAARRSAARDGRSFRLSRPATGAVLQLLRRGGFIDSTDPERVDFWLQGTPLQ